MVVLVTGGCGYIGSKLVRELPGEFPGQTIRILDNMVKEKYCSLLNLPQETKFEMIEGDIRSESDAKKALQDVEAVFHLADISNVPFSFKHKKLTRETNYRGAINIAKHSSSVDCFVYTSSAAFYGKTNAAVDEQAKCHPMSPYAKWKFQAEKEMLEMEKNNGFPLISIRFGTAVGWSVGIRMETIVDRFAYLACLGQSVTVWKSSVNIQRPFININDMVRAFIFAAKNKNRMVGQVFNAASENLSMKEILEIMKRNFPGFKYNISKQSDPNQASYSISSEKIKRLGFEFKHSVEDGVKEIKQKYGALSSFE